MKAWAGSAGSHHPARSSGSTSLPSCSVAVVALLLACSAALPVHAVVFPSTAVAPDKARECLLRKFNSTTSVERKVFSQWGEDGIIETIFECIGTTNKFYAEFGVGDATECTHRNLRENHGFKGLAMDGGYYRPEINLQKEFLYSFNIVQLFQKHSVPSPSFDHLTVDLDQNTFWVALALLRGGYRPRSLAVEFNRNFAWSDSYATIDVPEEMAFFLDACEQGCASPPGVGDCYFGASAKAWVTMVKSFGYHLVAADRIGVNVFFVHESAAGKQPLLGLEDAKRLFTDGGEYTMINLYSCTRMVWVRIDGAVDFSEPSLDVRDLPLVMLGHKPAGRDNKHRIFYPVKHVDVMFKRKDTATVPAGQTALSQELLLEKPNWGDPLEPLEPWLVVSMLVAAFIAGALCQHFGCVLLAFKSSKRHFPR